MWGRTRTSGELHPGWGVHQRVRLSPVRQHIFQMRISACLRNSSVSCRVVQRNLHGAEPRRTKGNRFGYGAVLCSARNRTRPLAAVPGRDLVTRAGVIVLGQKAEAAHGKIAGAKDQTTAARTTRFGTAHGDDGARERSGRRCGSLGWWAGGSQRVAGSRAHR